MRLDWRGYELWPEELGWPDPATPGAEPPANRPPVPSRLDFLLAAENMEIPKVDRPKRIRTHNAHEAVEFAKTEGVADEYIEMIYGAYWEDGEDISDVKLLKKLAKGIVDDTDGLVKAIEKARFRHEIVGFDDPAHEKGVYNVPTFFIGEQKLAEQPYGLLRKAVIQAQEEGSTSSIYRDLRFPPAPEGRPYTIINMISTIDGKILSGERNESVSDLGSKTDHKLMKRLEKSVDAVMVGGQTLRATSLAWNPKASVRIVVSRTGDLPTEAAFFTEGRAYVATPGASTFHFTNGARVLRAGGETLDFELLLSRVRTGLGVEKLLVLGGSELNAELLSRDLVDELFMTVAPKVKLGREVPTYAGGEPLPRESLLGFRLVEHHVVGDEVFLRYRRERKK